MRRVFKETVQEKKKPQGETDADARTLGWILAEKVRGGSWRCIWAELKETQGKDGRERQR